MHPGDRSESSLLSRKSVVGVKENWLDRLRCSVLWRGEWLVSLHLTTPPDKGGLEILGTNPLHRVRDVCKESSYCCYLLVVHEPGETRHRDQPTVLRLSSGMWDWPLSETGGVSRFTLKREGHGSSQICSQGDEGGDEERRKILVLLQSSRRGELEACGTGSLLTCSV